jgi:pyruvate kinase
MLSEETAVGHYPTDTVRTMSEVAEAAESWPRSRTTPEGAGAAADDDRVAWAVAHAAVQAAEDLGVAAIVCPTQSGATARRVAAFRPSVPIAGIASAPEVLGRMCLAWGVRPISMTNPPASDDEAMREAVRAARQCGLVQKGDLIAVVFASPGKRAGATDTVRIVRA